MQIDVQLFGPLAELADAGVIRVEVDEQADAAQVLRALGESVPALGSALGTCRLAVNHDYASPGDRVSTGDEVALIGMVSGG